MSYIKIKEIDGALYSINIWVCEFGYVNNVYRRNLFIKQLSQLMYATSSLYCLTNFCIYYLKPFLSACTNPEGPGGGGIKRSSSDHPSLGFEIINENSILFSQSTGKKSQLKVKK
jgi:hypothetical protein